MIEKETVLKTIATVPRECEFCGRSYSFQKEFKVWGSGWGDDTQRRLRERLEEEIDEDDSHMLCPHCRQFPSEVMDEQFPDGFRERLMWELKLGNLVRLAWSFPAVLLVGALLYFLVDLSLNETSLAPLPYHLVRLAFALPLLALFAYLLVRPFWIGVRDRLLVGRYRRQLEALSDAQVLSIVEALYEECDKRILWGFGWGWHRTYHDQLTNAIIAANSAQQSSVATATSKLASVAAQRTVLWCDGCRKKFKVALAAAARTVKCPKCGTRLKPLE